MSKGFKHELGSKAKSITRGFTGVIGSRSECLYGCNRYFIEPPADKDGKLSDSYWFDEDDIEIIKKPKTKRVEKDTGGPASTRC